jgi:uncharacterized membrane protein
LSKKETPASLIGIVAILAWFVLFSVGMLRHLTFHSKAWDLAIFDQVIWNLANGNGWQCSVRGVQDLRGDHFEPILLIFVPIYRLMPHVGWLLGAQAAALVGAGVILWATYRRKIGDSAAFMLFLAYLFFPPIHWLSIADFPPIALAPLFVMIAWWGRERGRVGAFIAGLIGLGLCGEEGFIVAGWWGFWEFLVSGISRATRRPAIGWTGLAAMVFFWAGFVYLSAVYILHPTGSVDRSSCGFTILGAPRPISGPARAAAVSSSEDPGAANSNSDLHTAFRKPGAEIDIPSVHRHVDTVPGDRRIRGARRNGDWHPILAARR